MDVASMGSNYYWFMNIWKTIALRMFCTVGYAHFLEVVAFIN
jgi:hypothetical protein